MIYLENYELFENSSSRNSRSEIIGKLLHVYGSIPLFKQKSSVVIKKMLWKNPSRPKYPFFKLGEYVNLEGSAPHDKVRFVDYFDSLINSKETRGHNFEGTIAGLYNGELSKPGEKWDVVIDKQSWSVKFIDISSKAPEIGKYKNSLENHNLDHAVISYGGLTKLYQHNIGTENTQLLELKENVWTNVISSGITGGWLIAHPYKGDIIVYMIDLENMKNILFKGYTVSPKGGLKDVYSLALSTKYKLFAKNFIINIPKVDIKELKSIYLNKIEDKWSKEIFGQYSNRIRPDVLRYIKANKEDIAKKLLTFKDF